MSARGGFAVALAALVALPGCLLDPEVCFPGISPHPADDAPQGFFGFGHPFGLKAPTAAPHRATRKSAPRVATDPDAMTFIVPPDVPPPNHAEMRLPYELMAPFRVECVVGLCDPAFWPATSSVFGMSVFETSGAGRNFPVDCSRVGGITATAGFGVPAPHAFADSTRLDLAIEHDGTNLVGYARDHETGGTWFEVSRTALPETGPFLMRIGALDFDPGQMIGFYGIRVPGNSPLAEGATPEHRAVRELGDALVDLQDSFDALTSATPDPARAAAEQQSASSHVTAAVAALDAASVGKKPSRAAKLRAKARKAALKAGKNVAKAVAKLQSNPTGGVVAAMKGAGKATLDVAKAADGILPEDLRAASGGLTFASFLGK